MKKFFHKKEIGSLWKENGDLEQLEYFFQTIEATSVADEQTKQRIKQKALAKIENGAPAPSSLLPDRQVNRQGSVGQRLLDGLRNLSGRRRWRIGVPAVSAAGLVILLIVWLAFPSSSGNLLPGLSTASDINQTTKDQDAHPSSGSEMTDRGDDSRIQADEIIASIDPWSDEAARADTISDADASPEMKTGKETEAPTEENATLPPNSVADARTAPTHLAGIPDKSANTDASNQMTTFFAGAAGENEMTDAEAEIGADRTREQTDLPVVTAIPQVTNNLNLTLEVASASDSLFRFSGEVYQLEGYVVGAQQDSTALRSASYLKIELPAAKVDQLCALLAAEGKIIGQQLQESSPGDQSHNTPTDYAVINIKFVGK